MKYLRIYNISIHINFYQNRFINECARKLKAKIPESQSFTVFLGVVDELAFLIRTVLPLISICELNELFIILSIACIRMNLFSFHEKGSV